MCILPSVFKISYPISIPLEGSAYQGIVILVSKHFFKNLARIGNWRKYNDLKPLKKTQRYFLDLTFWCIEVSHINTVIFKIGMQKSQYSLQGEVHNFDPSTQRGRQILVSLGLAVLQSKLQDCQNCYTEKPCLRKKNMSQYSSLF